jgi:peptide/nickel transport system ATP-binding protein
MNEAGTPLLKVDNLRTYIPSRRGIVHAVDGVSFELHTGKTLAIAGESGCGKSVLCRTIMGLLPEKARICKGSSIRFNGKQLIGLRENGYRRLRATRMAMIFQDPFSSLHPMMTIGRQISESMCYHFKMNRRQAQERVVGLIRAVGLSGPDKVSRLYPHQLSGGMRQRIAIAIALACDPELLIADEPTTALDVTVQAGILALLNSLQAERKMTIIMVTHNLGVASNVADRIAVMYAGKIVETAPASDLFTRPNHPYTKALIDSVPRIDQSSNSPLFSIKGGPYDPVNPLAGCRFSTRCPQAKDLCRSREPMLKADPGNNHFRACWYPLREDLS